ncbi:MAG TPA: FAD-dependent oxidoreductase, partial [Vicinamibacteria bacterium]|nr:FAD-dependent oxidoreductase [Vicinamibacteria bacterium]
MTRGPVVVLGGGVAGLAAGYYLAREGWGVTLVEQAPVVGGLCGSFESHGFTLDYGPHKLYSVVPGILDEIRTLMGDGLIEHKKKNRIRLLDRFLNYPLALGNLLPLLGPWRAARLGMGY